MEAVCHLQHPVTALKIVVGSICQPWTQAEDELAVRVAERERHHPHQGHLPIGWF